MTNAAEYVPYGRENAKTRAELVMLSGESDRQVREDLRLASINGDLILNLQDGKGYFRPEPGKDDYLVKIWLMMAQSRVKEEVRKMHIAEKHLQRI